MSLHHDTEVEQVPINGGAEAAVDEKWVAQQFIWSHPMLDWRRVLEEENWEPRARLSDDTI